MPNWNPRIVCTQPEKNPFKHDLSELGDIIPFRYCDGSILPQADILVMIEPPLGWLERAETECKGGVISLLAMSEPTAQHIRAALNRLDVAAICGLDETHEKVESLLGQIRAEKAKRDLFPAELAG